jgi:cardiolipin synthase (CMP-forming)
MSNQVDDSRILTVPNLLTVVRLILTGFFIVFGVKDQWVLAFWFFVIAGGTDLIDGSVARWLNQRSRFGSFLDPLADKIMMGTSVILLAYKSFVPIWFLVVVFARDLLIIYGLIIYKIKKVTIKFAPTFISKVTTLLSISTVSLAMCQPLAEIQYGPFTTAGVSLALPYFIYGTGVLTFISMIQYYIIGMRIFREATTGSNGNQV